VYKDRIFLEKYGADMGIEFVFLVGKLAGNE
jgi:hypothetical protein